MRINDVIGQLTSAFLDWDHLLANPRYVRKDRVITWASYGSIFLRMPITNVDLVQLAEAGQYTFQVFDGSMLQLYYAYGDSDDELTEARLAYYMASKVPDVNEESDTEGAMLDVIPISWLRIDYSMNEGDVLHSSTHLHLGGFPAGRLTVAGVPTPRQFIELVVSIAYPEQYREHRLNGSGNFKEPVTIDNLNRVCLRAAPNLNYARVPHLRVPVYPG